MAGNTGGPWGGGGNKGGGERGGSRGTPPNRGNQGGGQRPEGEKPHIPEIEDLVKKARNSCAC